MSSQKKPAGEPERRGQQKLTDPRAIRALAHPVRMALLEILAHAGTLTATQASDALGESPANCAFHLRTLAKYGFVEEAGRGHGRERPWRRTHEGIRLSESADDPRTASAAQALSGLMTDIVLDRARDSLARENSWPAEWRRALSQSENLIYLTAEEASQMHAELSEILARHIDRIDHPERRPAGAMPVEVLLISHPLLHLAGIPTNPPAPGGPADDPEEQS